LFIRLVGLSFPCDNSSSIDGIVTNLVWALVLGGPKNPMDFGVKQSQSKVTDLINYVMHFRMITRILLKGSLPILAWELVLGGPKNPIDFEGNSQGHCDLINGVILRFLMIT
jgi:hypothetical protein